MSGINSESVLEKNSLLRALSYDAGNLDRVEQCRTQFEYNLWTAPDCAGTPYENGNRTWFHFSVKIPDGTVNKIMK